MELIEDKYQCVECKRIFSYEDGRYAYPTGDRCTPCGEQINLILKKAETLVSEYKNKSGYKGVRISLGV